MFPRLERCQGQAEDGSSPIQCCSAKAWLLEKLAKNAGSLVDWVPYSQEDVVVTAFRDR